ncbi:cap-specific mRNA (nucleoside-2'-O-)-methyltransferase 1 isoform X2 [Daktulosphaira vitifoliae]|uniref:cap-specific mRNA (nucleoside-2'-O-)-methyltransferase 1 isoform X2 n=1 Tax=Daktulosphaira vitifoliae TaxID=58002 RepID=UPI0021A98D05|nr:cap-specific mRNA (nucleoside-2'-O-)-methyltransferase 1 isoform X2 [Daktulosphaira vitifoliae]
MSANLSDSSDVSLEDEMFQILHTKKKKTKKRTYEDTVTSKFYTNDGRQSDLPYVADNVKKAKKQKKNKQPKKYPNFEHKSTIPVSSENSENMEDTLESNFVNVNALNSEEKSYLSNPCSFMKNTIGSDNSDSDPYESVSHQKKKLSTRQSLDNCSKFSYQSDSNSSDDQSSKDYVENEKKSSNKGMSLMKKIGYKEGEGLGKNAQGSVNPVQLPTQKGRRGLGFSSQAPKDAFILDWNSDMKELTELSKITEWVENDTPVSLTYKNMLYWIQAGEKKLTYDQTTEFADPEIFKVVNSSKNVLDNIDDHEFRQARTKANPFETIKNGIFQNRAAMKMANIDWACDFMFTEPKYSNGSSMLSGPSDLVYFADICAGPGGFSEYVLWRKGWRAKGIGFTLRNENDFKLNDFYAGSPESFQTYYGSAGDGDIYKPKNISSLKDFVMNVTQGKGVHFVMADGGFSVEGQETFQEILSKRLYLCQTLAALNILQVNGHFMCKLFDIFTEFSAGLLYLLYHCFKKISIYKPVTSRPANSERYVICKSMKNNIEDIQKYLFHVNITWNELGSNEDILSIVPFEEITKDSIFFNYLWKSNNKLGQIQALSLSKIVAFTKDHRLADDRQKDLKKKCLEMWNVKDDVRRAPFRGDIHIASNNLITGSKDFLECTPEILNKKNFQKNIKSKYDWHCVLLNDYKPPTFFISLGGSQVYELNNGRWTSNESLKNITMSPGTLVYGELVYELEGENLGQLRVKVLHIIDACKLGNIDISSEHYLTRIEYCKNFAKSMNTLDSDQTKIRVKEPEYLENISEIFERIDLRWSKYHRKQVKMYSLDERKYCWANGMLFINATMKPWMRALSRTYNKMYYWHPNQSSIYEEQNPTPAYASFRECCKTNKIWFWMDEHGNPIVPENKEQQLQKEDILRHLLV